MHHVRLIAIALACCVSNACGAHEFWLEPSTFTPKTGESLPVSIRIGQNFKGDSFPYLRDDQKSFVIVDAKGERPLKGIDGDDPAITTKLATSGLAVFAHYSTAESVTFDTWDEFERYLALEGNESIGPRHLKEGKPTTKIKEVYFRCAKLLVSVGTAGGDDRLTGMPLELVAERNPYKLGEGEPLPVRLFYRGKPLADIQVTMIAKAEPEKRVGVRTDVEGRAKIPLPVRGAWLLNAVHMVEPEAAAKAQWASYWASMTFSAP